jgi:hypothetical protein
MDNKDFTHSQENAAPDSNHGNRPIPPGVDRFKDETAEVASREPGKGCVNSAEGWLDV